MKRFWSAISHPMSWLRDLCGGESAFPLIVLFGLNAVDELDRTAFGILLPEIREDFGIDLQTALGLVALASIAAILLSVPIAQHVDRSRRVPVAIAGAVVWAVFSGMTGLATGVVMLTVARSGSSIGKAVVDPTHNSLLADYYPIAARSRVYSTHRAANAIGAFIGPLSAGLLAAEFTWRAPFLIFVVPTMVFAILALRLREPVRGRYERVAAGANEDVANTEEVPPSFAESWRMVQKVQSLRRIWWSLPFLAVALVGFVTLASQLYDREFGLGEKGRGFAAAFAEPFQLIGIVYGARIITRRYMNNMEGLIRFLAAIAVGSSVVFAAFALSPNIVFAVGMNCAINAGLAALAPGIYVAFSLAIPPRARATGFTAGSLWAIPGLVVLPFIGWVGDHWGIRVGMLVMVPLFLTGSLILRSCASVINDDIAQVWRATAARSEALYQRRHGGADLLLVRGVDAGYGGRQVLFGVDLDVKEGEIVALLGVNGAGKSTLLKAISGIVEADRGAIVLDGRDITHAPPNEIAVLGISQMPGGAGVFGSLTIRENLQLAGWTQRRKPDEVAASIEAVLDMFPVLRTRLDMAAADLSGGQQQMLALGMAFIAKPRVLLIDELSLGLAPVIVGQMLPIIERLASDGVAIVMVEQSVNVALTVAHRAYFLERGMVQFSGATGDLLRRPDLLRSVFLSNASIGAPTAHAVFEAADGATPTLAVQGLVRSFGGITAVSDVSFEVAPCEIVGIIGPNGAGKTTLFDLISGFIPADAGLVFLSGRDVSDSAAFERAAAGLGRSFQDARLFPEITVAETLAVATERFVANRSVLAAALRLPQMYDSEQATAKRVDELLELMGLGHARNLFVRELSTGMRRIVDLACQVAHRPIVVLLDEPSSGIAQREVEELAPVLLRLRREMGASLVVIEHDMPLVSSISDRLIALDQGSVVTMGLPRDVLENPDVIESYLGTSSAAISRSGTDPAATRG
jgi:ABC-type branched-subunit amino acid transport system ATPase component/MFS family permease